MTVHICRDFIVGPTGSIGNFWALSAFMQYVLGFSRVGTSGVYDYVLPRIYGSGTMLDFPGQQLYTNGNRARLDIPLNQMSQVPHGSPTTYAIPALLASSSGYLMPTGSGQGEASYYKNNVLAIKSQNNSLANSGLFSITSMSYSPGCDTSIGSVTGTYRIDFDYRSSGSMPPDNNFSWTMLLPQKTDAGDRAWVNGASMISDNNGNWSSTPSDSLYHTSGSSGMLRAIYQSPDPSGWQVRLCIESYYDRTNSFGSYYGGTCFSIAPGVGGVNGDFPDKEHGGRHLHVPAWYNSVGLNYIGAIVGIDPVLNNNWDNIVTNVMWRFFAWGDDSTGTCFIVNRNMHSAHDSFALFGMPEDETLPLPSSIYQRLFVIGQCIPSDHVSWNAGCRFDDFAAGFAYSLNPTLGPISCTMSCYSYAAFDNARDNGDFTSTFSGSIRYDGFASDTPFLKATELISADLFAGTWYNSYAGDGYQIFPFEPRRMGRVPFARLGRVTGQPKWFTVDSTNTWFHVDNGVYLPWGGIQPLPA